MVWRRRMFVWQPTLMLWMLPTRLAWSDGGFNKEPKSCEVGEGLSNHGATISECMMVKGDKPLALFLCGPFFPTALDGQRSSEVFVGAMFHLRVRVTAPKSITRDSLMLLSMLPKKAIYQFQRNLAVSVRISCISFKPLDAISEDIVQETGNQQDEAMQGIGCQKRGKYVNLSSLEFGNAERLGDGFEESRLRASLFVPWSRKSLVLAYPFAPKGKKAWWVTLSCELVEDNGGILENGHNWQGYDAKENDICNKHVSISS